MNRSAEFFSEAKRYIPGGVNSPVRAFTRVGGQPVFFKSGDGAWLTDEDGNRYIDYVGSWGPMIVGHADPLIVRSVQEAIAHGLSFGAPTAVELTLAKKIHSMLPSMELIRMVNSGTEATMSAIRVARGFTRRNKILKFEGCYHGHSDSLLVKAGSGALTLGEPDSLGVPESFAKYTITSEYNNTNQLEQLFSTHGREIAAVIVEPIAGNMGCIPPIVGFLEAIRKQCDQHGALLIFDEVMTGFRVARGGAQTLYGVTPDLTTLGKIIGGGMPVGAFGGRKDVMEMVAPLGEVYQAGTLSGNPVAMHAGLATLELIDNNDFYSNLEEKTNRLIDGLKSLAEKFSIPFSTNNIGSMFSFFFIQAETVSYLRQVKDTDAKHFNIFFHSMLNEGINLAPSPFESGFVSAAHGQEELDKTLEAAEKAFQSIK